MMKDIYEEVGEPAALELVPDDGFCDKGKER